MKPLVLVDLLISHLDLLGSSGTLALSLGLGSLIDLHELSVEVFPVARGYLLLEFAQFSLSLLLLLLNKQIALGLQTLFAFLN